MSTERVDGCLFQCLFLLSPFLSDRDVCLGITADNGHGTPAGNCYDIPSARLRHFSINASMSGATSLLKSNSSPVTG